MAKEYRHFRFDFDPTANMAIAHVTRELKHPRSLVETPQSDTYHASPEDLARFTGSIFEPDVLVSDRTIKQLRHRQRVINRLAQVAN